MLFLKRGDVFHRARSMIMSQLSHARRRVPLRMRVQRLNLNRAGGSRKPVQSERSFCRAHGVTREVWHGLGVLVPILEPVDGVIVISASGVAPDAVAVRVAVRRPHTRADVRVMNRHVRLYELWVSQVILLPDGSLDVGDPL